jgi:hypothetical protein
MRSKEQQSKTGRQWAVCAAKLIFAGCFLGLTAGALFAQVDVLTAQYGLSRTSSSTQETILTPANVNSAQFGRIFTRPVDAPFYASPLIVTNFNVPGVGVRDLVYVATLGNSVYAFDADDPNASSPYWSVNLGSPLQTSCCFLGPTLGILSTPVIDRSTNTIYLTAIIESSGDVGLYLFALDLGTGALKFNSPQRITYTFPSGVTNTDATTWLQRAALLLYNNVLYVGTANVQETPGVTKTQEGFIQTFQANDLSVRLATFETTPTGQGGAFWQAGRGLAVDSSGNVYAAFDSDDYNPPTSFGDSVVKFGPGSLSPIDWFTPSDWSFLYAGNLDETAGGVTLIPGTTLAFTGGKAGVVYLLNQNKLGGLEMAGTGPVQEFQASQGCGTTDCGQTLPTAFWPNTGNPYLYVWDAQDYLRAYPFDLSSQQFLTGVASVGSVLPSRTGGLTVSSNGNNAGIVWATTAAQDPFFNAVPGTLRAYNANNITQELYNSDQNSCRDALGTFVKMSTPIVANGKVYVNTQSNFLSVYGLLPTTGTVHVTVGTNVSGPTVTVDGAAPCAGAQGFDWLLGSTHSLSTSSTQSGGTGTQFLWHDWSDGLGISHTVTASASTTQYTADFQTQYLLTTQVSPVGSETGSISPATGFFNAATPVEVTATADSGFTSFTGFAGGASGTTNPAYVTMTGPLTVTANFQYSGGTCLCTIWSSSATPEVIDSGPGGAVELGVKFRADSNGVIAGIRFYKSSANTGTHVGNLWSSAGVLLATATFTNETSSGWQQVNFSSPVAITANTVYVASYFTTVSHFSVDSNAFATAGVDNALLHALASGVSGGNGVYLYSSTSGFPNNTYEASNYWVDVVFEPTPTIPLVSIAVAPASPTITAGGTQQFTATGTYQDNSTLNISAQVAWNSSNTTAATINSAGLATGLSAGNSNITANLSGITSNSAALTVQSPALPACPCTIWSPGAAPVVADSGAGPGVELGVKFTSSVSGTITGVRFYKSSANTGTHVGNLWSSTGTLLASATFSSETASGWQEADFSSPVNVTANTMYVASYHTNVSHFSADQGFFAANGVISLPLQALASAVNGGDGVYAYGSISSFPSNSYNSTNYWVDVVFATTPTYPLALITVTPNNSTNPTVNVGAPEQFTAIGTYEDHSTQNISTQVTWSSTNLAAATINGAGLAMGLEPGSTTISAALSGIQSNSVNLNVQAAPPPSCPCTIWSSSAVPTVIDAGAGGSVELGVKFTADSSGLITGIRFYKGSANTGTHVGSLWSSTGTLLAQATFTGETASGWQEVNFSSPVMIAANTMYVASYHTNVSHFSIDLNTFTTAGVDNAPLHALANGVSGGDGVYLYSSISSFPTNTYDAANYWVDVVFSTTALSPLSSIAVTPASPTVNVGANQQFTAIATYQNNSSQNISAQVAWSSSNLAAATINGVGLATGLSAGASNITATLSGIQSNIVPLTVVSAPPPPPPTCPCTIWNSSAVSSVIDAGAGGAVELGVKFRSDVSGMVTGLRFYKSSANTGTHIGNVWSSTGTLLTTATFTNETTSGWQEVDFSNPVAIAANTVYVASYHTNVSHFSFDANAFASAGVDNPPLHALENGVSGGDGVYLYSSTSAFPTNTYNAANYWVDVVFHGAFVPTGSMNLAREVFHLVPLNNGLVLAVDGTVGPADPAELYNPANGTFTPTGVPTTPRYFFTATLLNNGKVLIAGGNSFGVALGSAELYDPATGTFTATGSMNSVRYSHTATLLGNGMVLITGGRTSASSPLASAELYDPVAGTFTVTGNLNTARADHTATLLGDGTVLIAGGQSFNGSLPASAEIYSTTNGSFAVAGNLNTPRTMHTATLLQNGTVLIAAGSGSNSNLASAELYNPATQSFTLTGSLNTARIDDTATLLNSGMVLMAGGIDPNGVVLASAELYNPVTGTFTSAATMNSAREAHAAALLSDGLVLFAGGANGVVVTTAAELY